MTKEKKRIKAWAVISPKDAETLYGFPFEYLGNQHLSKDHSATPFFPDKFSAREYIRDRKNNGLHKRYKVVSCLIKIID